MNGKKEELLKAYRELFDRFELEPPLDTAQINGIIRRSINNFLDKCSIPAIYCYGEHTQILMADFIFELKKVNYIIDNYVDISKESGFKILRDDEIERSGIDGVIISTYKFRNDVKKNLVNNHPNIRWLDLYEEFEKEGIVLNSDYYYNNHPYHHYRTINNYQRLLSNTKEKKQKDAIYKTIISQYLQIKDFLVAIKKANDWGNNKLERAIKKVYELELEAAKTIDPDSVLMLCMDGLRREDLTEEMMPHIVSEFVSDSYVMDNAYSYSTSTYESLIPAYSETVGTEVVQNNAGFIPGDRCRFICEAKKQGRNIHFYTDSDRYIADDAISYSETFMTATEKLWSFIVDASQEKRGLYYIHILYESHFTFSNPYTEDKIMAEGTAMLFDFLPVKGGKLRADYKKQHDDALRYLDDVVSPVLNMLKCRIVLFADHGNLVMPYKSKLEDIYETKYTCAEEWIRIPFVIHSPEIGVGRDSSLFSIMSINDILIGVMNKEKIQFPQFEHIRIGRTAIYNPDFHKLYKLANVEQGLMAFQGFVFSEGYKLVIFSDGSMNLYSVSDDMRIEDESAIKDFYNRVKNEGLFEMAQ